MLRLLFCLRPKRSHPPAPLLLLLRKRARARLACSVVNALTAARYRYHPFAGIRDRNRPRLPIRVFIWTLGFFILPNVVMNIHTRKNARKPCIHAVPGRFCCLYVVPDAFNRRRIIMTRTGFRRIFSGVCAGAFFCGIFPPLSDIPSHGRRKASFRRLSPWAGFLSPPLRNRTCYGLQTLLKQLFTPFDSPKQAQGTYGQ